MILIQFFTLALGGLILPQSAFAKLSKNNWQIDSGSLSYHVSYPLKKVDGLSKNVKGKGTCTAETCQFLIAAPVKSFESGDGNRDNHMLEVTRAGTYPMIVVKVSFKEPKQETSFDATVEVTFAGKTRTYEHVKIDAQITDSEVTTKGTLPLVLSNFDVERPSLLTVKIDDAAPVTFDLKWR